MRTIGYIVLALILPILLLNSCKSDDDPVYVPGYLVSYNEHTPSVSYKADDIKGYLKQKELADLSEMAKYEVKLYKVNYKTAFEGDSITVSGLLAMPVSTDNKVAFPILSYQHEIITRNADAPSVKPMGETTALITYLASTGFVVLLPDYIGFGASSDKFHPFMHKEYSVNATLDFIRASKELIVSKKLCKINDNLFLSGYSQGASVTLSSLNAIENDPKNSDLIVKATACGAGIYSIPAYRSWMMSQVKYDQPYYMVYMLESFKKYLAPELDYSLVFNEPVASLIPGMIDGIKTGNEINALFHTLHIGELYADGYKSNETFGSDANYAQLASLFQDNSVEPWALKSEVTIFYGKTDSWVPSEQSLLIYSELRNAGSSSKVKIDAMNNLDHPGAFFAMLTKKIKWFQTY
jgi:pimeloyl-ACP methyl ester carboxylesterase